MKRLIRWTTSTNAKDIAVLYFIYGLFSALLATTLSVLIRIELSSVGMQYIISEKYGQIYNVMVTAHGLLMVFYFIMPTLIGGFGSTRRPKASPPYRGFYTQST
jgi:heme/copper-type cytochrome/quinol oxidase subunit 1